VLRKKNLPPKKYTNNVAIDKRIIKAIKNKRLLILSVIIFIKMIKKNVGTHNNK
jgi:hypothetical protein